VSWVNKYWIGHTLVIAIGCIVAFQSFLDIPSVIRTAQAAGWLEIHFLPAALAHVA
jgi:hypothetical protein